MEKPDEEDPVFMKVEGRHYLPLYAPYYKIVHNYLVCLKYTEITYGKKDFQLNASLSKGLILNG
jgi:hypothetical protein